MNATAMNATTHSMEHRWGDRLPVHATAEVWSAEGANHEALISNASLSGAFLRTTAVLAPLSQISLRILPDGDWLEACVVRNDDTGMAVEWLDPGLRPLNALSAFGQKRPSHDDVAHPDAATTPASLQLSVEHAALERARSEIDSDEFDVQG